MDTEQERLMDEECILVDVNDVPNGHASKRIAHAIENIRAGMLHRAFSVFLFNSRGELLLQQRAHTKVTFPLCWTNTCCSHPLYKLTETYTNGAAADGHADAEAEETDALGVKRAAVRKLAHELNIAHNEVRTDNLHFLTKIYYCSASDQQWGEHEIDWILFTQTDLPLSASASASSSLPFNVNEVEDIRWVTQTQLKEMIAQWRAGELKLTPWFALIAEKLLFNWWNQLEQILKDGGIGPEQRTVIHRLNQQIQ